MSPPQTTKGLDQYFDQGDKLRRERLPFGVLQSAGLPLYANNAAALAGGLAVGDFYIVTATDPAQLAVVV